MPHGSSEPHHPWQGSWGPHLAHKPHRSSRDSDAAPPTASSTGTSTEKLRFFCTCVQKTSMLCARRSAQATDFETICRFNSLPLTTKSHCLPSSSLAYFKMH